MLHMERYLRPERLDVEPDTPNATTEWKHWFSTFKNFLSSMTEGTIDNHKLLINFLSPKVYENILDSESYESAVENLKSLYEKPANEVFARHLLSTRKQNPGESLDQYIDILKQLSSDCNFKAVTADTCKDEAIRDAFISGITSQPIRLRLLENKTLDLQTAVTQARSLEAAARNCESYYQSSTSESTSDFLTNAAIPSGKTREAPNSSLGDFFECAAAKT